MVGGMITETIVGMDMNGILKGFIMINLHGIIGSCINVIKFNISRSKVTKKTRVASTKKSKAGCWQLLF